MTKWILAAACILFIFTGYAQENAPKNKGPKMTGRVVDSLTRSAVEYSTITIFLQDSTKPQNGTTSDQSGHFSIGNLSVGTYSVLIESIGYKSKQFNNIIISKTAGFNLGNILLSKSSKMLGEVTVTAPAGLVENKIDKLVYNAEKDLTSQGGVATDILKKVPQVSVDVDGNVELAGSTSIRFLINGKPSTAFGSNITDVLQSIPASQIKSIEVITNPGAKYDAEGLGGIINIILKSSKANGINGNISLTAGTRNENGSVNLNGRSGNFGINLYASGNTRLLATTPFESNRQTYDTSSKSNATLDQNGQYDFKRHGFETGIGFDWVYRKLNSFSGSLNYSNFGNSNVGQLAQTQSIYDGNGMPLSQIVSTNPSNNSFLFYNIDANVAYKRSFAREDQELNISLNSSYGHNQINSFSEQYWQPQDSLYFGTNSSNPGKERQTELQIDYTQPLKNQVKLEFGGKMVVRDISSNSVVDSYQPQTQSYQYSSSLSNSLVYDQTVYAAYAQASFPVLKWFDTKMGLRYERTDINANYSNAPQQEVESGYNTFVPSVSLIKKLTDDQTLKLSYSKRIERPDYRNLNPFINTTDPKNITSGNPYLQPEIGHRIELTYGRDTKDAGYFSITAFYRVNDGDIQPFIIFYPELSVGDSTFYNVNVTTFQNIGIEKNMGLSLFSDLHPTSALGIRTNIFMFQRHTINKIDTGYNSNSFNYRLNINLSYQFKKNFAAEFFGNFNSPRHEAQGKYPSFTNYSFAVRKQIWNKKGSIALMATNPFSEYVVQQTTLFGPGFNTNSTRKIPFRSVSINFTWKFGKLTFKKEKEHSDDNANPGSENGL
jgi:outer membrane receptor protein involved in Fe transport